MIECTDFYNPHHHESVHHQRSLLFWDLEDGHAAAVQTGPTTGQSDTKTPQTVSVVATWFLWVQTNPVLGLGSTCFSTFTEPGDLKEEIKNEKILKPETTTCLAPVDPPAPPPTHTRTLRNANQRAIHSVCPQSEGKDTLTLVLREPKAGTPLNTHESVIRAPAHAAARRWESSGSESDETLTQGEHSLQMNAE